MTYVLCWNKQLVKSLHSKSVEESEESMIGHRDHWPSRSRGKLSTKPPTITIAITITKQIPLKLWEP